jgi:ribulose-5-phosphate 4-epimerase/fuculose-1-phosphate aldolase/GNAT superfamily N-acetyltransferase
LCYHVVVGSQGRLSTVEGYFKFEPRFVATVDIAEADIARLNHWRERMVALGLIGAYPSGPYRGAGYGNISERTPHGFLVSATRTGGLPHLGTEHYCEILGFDLARNTVDFGARSPATTPSSECMTHGAFYQADPSIGAVIHVHHRALWERLLDLFPTTGRQVEYGTPEMGGEILRLYRESDLAGRKVAVMGGHEEGIIGFGRDLDEAGAVLLAEVAALGRPFACRPMRPGEEAEVIEMVRRSFAEFVAPGYSPQGAASFLEYAAPEALAARQGPGCHFVLVSEIGGELAGMIEIRSAEHVSMLFVAPAHLREGIAGELWRLARGVCCARRPGLSRITVNSSPYAVPVYEHLGFQRTGDLQERNGLIYQPMAAAQPCPS